MGKGNFYGTHSALVARGKKGGNHKSQGPGILRIYKKKREGGLGVKPMARVRRGGGTGRKKKKKKKEKKKKKKKKKKKHPQLPFFYSVLGFIQSGGPWNSEGPRLNAGEMFEPHGTE